MSSGSGEPVIQFFWLDSMRLGLYLRSGVSYLRSSAKAEPSVIQPATLGDILRLDPKRMTLLEKMTSSVIFPRSGIIIILIILFLLLAGLTFGVFVKIY